MILMITNTTRRSRWSDPCGVTPEPPPAPCTASAAAIDRKQCYNTLLDIISCLQWSIAIDRGFLCFVCLSVEVMLRTKNEYKTVFSQLITRIAKSRKTYG